MGVKLIKYYKYVAEELGIDGKHLLARETVLPSILAATAEDSPEIIAKFREAIEKLTGKPAPHY